MAKAQPGAAFYLESPFLTGFQKACADLEGNLYVSGYFQRQLSLGGATFWADRGAYFLAKYRPDFTLVWARQLTAPPRDLAWSGTQLLVLGQFQHELYLGRDTLRSAGGFDAFVAALDTQSGNCQWYRHLSASRDVLAQALSTDTEGNVYLTGGFEGNFSLDGHHLERDLFKNAYLIKLNAQGQCQWATRLSGGHNPLTGVFVRSLAFDAQGFLWLGGNLCGAGRFAQKMIYSSTEQYFAEGRVYNHDIFVACYQPDGILRWVKTLAQNADLQVLLPDHQGYLYLAGHFQGSTNLNRPQQLGMAKFGRQSLKAALSAGQHPVEDSFWQNQCLGAV
ncbi:MAG: hypothetical protein HC913_02005 [Microscillaceae bacterium]|nr:hypothetical protein [Microscillaceae bacterium]